MRLLPAVVVLFAAGIARGERHVVQRGETLEHIAIAHSCSVDALMRANDLRTTLVAVGTSIAIPTCSLRTRAQTRTVKPRSRDAATAPTSDDDKAKAALAVIDGAAWTAETRDRPETSEGTDEGAPHTAAIDTGSASIGAPWEGKLRGGRQLPTGDGYVVRRPSRAFGASHVVDHLRRSIAEVRALYPDVHTLAIGDISAEHGGKISAHHSHQSGLDVDVGFYFKRVPDTYPEKFAAASAQLDLEATWALLNAFARTASVADGVSIVFLDYAVQKRLYDYAHSRGTPDEDLAALLQYPRGKDTQVGLVRHWPNHADHLHVRFKPGR